MSVKFYQLADGRLTAEAGRGTSPPKIKELQKQECFRKHGGICGVVEYSEPRAIYFAQHNQ